MPTVKQNVRQYPEADPNILLTFTVPCYNSEAYMEHCIDSLLTAGEDTEIIIVNDGSVDRTGEIADSYVARYPDRVRAIHQENGGHGEGVNQGIRNARGKYFKVVDSDDWLDEKELARLLKRMRAHNEKGKDVDMYVINYVYEHVEDNTTYVMHYRNVFPQNRFVGWEDTKPFGISQYLMMHSVFYRTQILRDCGVELPKHTFYVDNLFMYAPLPYVKTIYYMDLDVYRYFIGRADQSINENVIAKRVDQQIRVTRLVLKSADLNEIQKKSKRLYRYMMHEMSLMMMISTVFANVSKDKNNYKEIDKLWRFVKRHDPKTYRKLRWLAPCAVTRLKTPVGRKMVVIGYKVTKKIVKLG